MDITVYTLSRRHAPSLGVRSYLFRRGLPYNEVDTEEFPEARDALMMQGLRALPVVQVETDSDLVLFDRHHLEDMARYVESQALADRG